MPNRHREACWLGLVLVAAGAVRSRDYELGVVELRPNADGEGEGKTIPAAKLSLGKMGKAQYSNQFELSGGVLLRF